MLTCRLIYLGVLNHFAGALDICVLIPCYNNLPGLLRSLSSIQYQPEKLLVLVVDDGSKEPVAEEALRNVLAPGLKLQVLRMPENAGITKALNLGLTWILHKLNVRYIARLDCADLCHPDRFFEQFSFMEQHPEVGLSGTWCYFENPDSGWKYAYRTPLDHAAIVREMHFRNVFIHPTVMIRTSLVKKVGLYPEDYPHAEDYAWFMKMLRVTHGAILDKFLITCEINPTGISLKNRSSQLKARARVVSDFATNQLFKFAGLLRLQILRQIPYRFIHFLKKGF